MREYLKKYAFGNATWLDLVSILEARNPGQVAKWSHAWVELRGRPEITTAVRLGSRREAREPDVDPARSHGSKRPVAAAPAGHRGLPRRRRAIQRDDHGRGRWGGAGEGEAAAAVRHTEWRRVGLRPLQTGYRDLALPARPPGRYRRSANPRQRVGGRLGEPAGGAGEAGGTLDAGRARATARDRRAEHSARPLLS